MNILSLQTLTIVVPALNEELAIAATIEGCLAARSTIKDVAGLDVEVIVVSDGSTDRTAEIAAGFHEVNVIVFEVNRGYGAAIKEGFAQGTGEIVGFLDADGTCNPLYFADLCRVLLADKADIVLGSRLGPDSRMPAIRKFGNRAFALLLGFLCGRRVTDTASGMRVIRRDVLDLLYPLPDRMHFTPSMSARALLNGLRVVEVPMRYEERVGTSKLSVLSDGALFLMTILEGVLCFRPERPFLILFSGLVIAGILLGAFPTEYYWRHRRVEEWMIYRFIVCFLMGSAAFLLLCAAVLANRMASHFGPRRRGDESFWLSQLSFLFGGKVLFVFVLCAISLSSALIWPGAVEFYKSGGITLHWSRVMVGAFGFLLAFQALVTKVLLKTIEIWGYQRRKTAPRSDAGASDLRGLLHQPSRSGSP